MKKIYFVRHGESEGNAGPIRQIATTPLTEKGRAQAAFVAERCSRLPIEVVLSSTMTRARETAHEENFDDLKARALAVLEYLSHRPEEHILVVTHGMFMRVVAACVVFGKELTGEECESFIRSFHMENTGISVLGYDSKERHPWWLWVWNDHAHLSELEG